MKGVLENAEARDIPAGVSLFSFFSNASAQPF